MHRLLLVINALGSVLLASLSVYLFDFLVYLGIPHDISSKGSLALYMVFWGQLIESAEDGLRKKFFTNIECVFAEKQKNFNISNTPEFDIPKNEEEYLTVFCKITIKGAAKYLQDVELKIFFPTWADINIKQTDSLEMVGNDYCIIKPKGIIAKGQEKDIELDDIITFNIIKNCVTDGKTFTSNLSVEKKWGMATLCCFVKNNKFKLRG